MAAAFWLLMSLLQGPGLTVADTKHDLTANPWGFLHQALSPWTDVFPLGQLQNQAYGYLFPHGLFFAVLDPLPDWVTQRLWWALLLFLAFAGTVKLLEATGTGSRTSRVIGGVLFALSPRIMTTLGAISSEAWTIALVPWILLPVVRILQCTSRPSTRRVACAALGSAVAVLCLGAVNAVATLAAVVPAVLWWLVQGVFAGSGAGQDAELRRLRRLRRRTALRFVVWWLPAGVLACFWWVGPLLILGRYSPPFTDYIESAGITTHWFNLGEVLRGTTSWTAFLSSERQAGFDLVTEAVFVAGTLAVVLTGLAGLAGVQLLSRPSRRTPAPYAVTWLLMLGAGVLVFGVAAAPFSPVADQVQGFLDGAGAPLRNLHKFDALIHLPLVVGVAHAIGRVRLVPRNSAERTALLHPEKNPQVVAGVSVLLVLAVVTAPAWTGRLVPEGGYRSVPAAWQEAADWLNDPDNGAGQTRTMILPEARSARQTWGNTRDEPAQALLDVPWVVRDAVPLVPPEAIRGIDGLQQDIVPDGAAGANPALADALLQQGVGYLLVRTDLARSADTPAARAVLRTLTDSAAADGFDEVADFGDSDDIRIFRVTGSGDSDGTPPDTRSHVVNAGDLEVTDGGPEVLPRLAAADAAEGRDGRPGRPRDRILTRDLPDDADVETVTDTPALRDHNYGNVTGATSEIRASDDEQLTRNPVRDYPVGDNDAARDGSLTHVRETGGRITASSSASDPTSLNGAEPYSGPSAAVDGVPETAWKPGTGSPINQSLTLDLDKPRSQMSLTARAAGGPLRVQATTSLDGQTVASTTTVIPGYREDAREDRPIILPGGEADRVTLRIVGAWGAAGVSELQLTEVSSGEDVTPRRDIVVPAGDGLPRRWVLGQEIYEYEMRRTITVPEPASESDPPVLVSLNSDRCAAGEDTQTTVDGEPLNCVGTGGVRDSVVLTPGEHEIRSRDRWVSLNVADPVADDRDLSAESSEPEARVIVTSTSVNAGREATLYGTEGTDATTLEPVTVNGWQQGWVVPPGVADGMDDAELIDALDVTFTPTQTYQRWLGAGLLGALLLVLGWVASLLMWRRERRQEDAGAVETLDVPDMADTTTAPGRAGSVALVLGSLMVGAAVAGLPGLTVGAGTVAVVLGTPPLLDRLPRRTADSPAVGVLRRLVQPVTLAMILGGIGSVLMVREPWGGGDYAGFSWAPQLLFLGCLVAVVCAVATGPRRYSSST